MWINLWFTDTLNIMANHLFLKLNFSENKLIFQVGEVSITKDDTLFLKGKGQEHKIQERVDSIKVIKSMSN